MRDKTVKMGMLTVFAVLIPCLFLAGGMFLLPRMIGENALPDVAGFAPIAIPIEDIYAPEYPILIAKDEADPASLQTAELPTEAGELPYRIMTSFTQIRQIAMAVNGLTYEEDTALVSALSSRPHYAFRFFKDGSPHVVTVYDGEYVAFDSVSVACRIRDGQQTLSKALAKGYEGGLVHPTDFPARIVGVGTRFNNLNTFGQFSPMGLDGYGEYRYYYGTIPVTTTELHAYWADFMRSGLDRQTLTVEDIHYLLSILPDVSKESVYFPAFGYFSLSSSGVKDPQMPILEACYYSPYSSDGLSLSEQERARFVNARNIFTNWLQAFSTRNAFLPDQNPFSSTIGSTLDWYPSQYWYVPGITKEFDDGELNAYTYGQQETLSFSCFRVTSDRIEYFEAGKAPVILLQVGDPSLAIVSEEKAS